MGVLERGVTGVSWGVGRQDGLMLRSISSWTLPIPVPFKGRRRRRGLAWQVDRETKAGHVTFSNGALLL